MQLSHPLLVQAAQALKARQAEAQLRERQQSIVGRELLTGLNVNPVMTGQQPGPLDQILGGAARIGEAYGDFLESDGLTGVINRNLGASLVPLHKQSPLDIAMGFAGTVGPGKVASGLARSAAKSARQSSKFDLDFFGQPVTILQNPSKERLMGLAKRSKHQALRRIVDPDTGDVFVWDAADPALHQFVAEQIGVKVDPSALDGLFLEGEELVRAVIR